MDTTGPIREPMILITDLEKQNAILSEWDGSAVQFWLFHVSLKRVAIRISQNDRNDDLYVSAGGCDRIRGPFSWKNCELRMTRSKVWQEGWPPGEQVIVSDQKNGFELVTSGAVLFCGRSKMDFIRSFDDFECEE